MTNHLLQQDTLLAKDTVIVSPLCHLRLFHIPSIRNHFIPFMWSQGRWIQSSCLQVRAECTPRQPQLIAGPSLMAEADAHQEQVPHAAQLSPGELGFEPATLWSLADLLYLLSHSQLHYFIFYILFIQCCPE